VTGAAGGWVSRWAARPAVGWIAGVLALLAAGALAFRHQAPQESSSAVVRFGVDLPAPARLSPIAPALVFSPDGRALAIADVRLSPDEPRIAFTLTAPTPDVWVADPARGRQEQGRWRSGRRTMWRTSPATGGAFC
jgi:hypothetical protein